MKNVIKEIKKNIIKFIRDYPVCLFFIISHFINSILVSLFTTGSFMIRPLFFDMGVVLLLGFLSLCIKGKKRNIYYFIVSFILILACVANAMYYNYYNSFISVSLIYTSVFLKDFGDVVVSLISFIKSP